MFHGINHHTHHVTDHLTFGLRKRKPKYMQCKIKKNEKCSIGYIIAGFESSTCIIFSLEYNVEGSLLVRPLVLSLGGVMIYPMEHFLFFFTLHVTCFLF
jgi:hypothetical protein